MRSSTCCPRPTHCLGLSLLTRVLLREAHIRTCSRYFPVAFASHTMSPFSVDSFPVPVEAGKLRLPPSINPPPFMHDIGRNYSSSDSSSSRSGSNEISTAYGSFASRFSRYSTASSASSPSDCADCPSPPDTTEPKNSVESPSFYPASSRPMRPVRLVANGKRF